ncbi:MAG: precorrin-2 C(20)-methyltransferase [Nitrospiraceae bacterium]|nr:MAG: precorrin-2 C(20)-methyltransferase [Nitrospiraceae bacterium]
MPGKLTVIGVGPGDPELLTVKALRALENAKIICVPKGREEGSSLALSIVQKAVDLDGKEIIEAHFPMQKTKGQGSSRYDRRFVPNSIPRVKGQEEENELDIKWDQTAQLILSKLRAGNNVAFLTLGDPTIYSTFYYLYDRLKAHLPDLDIEIIPGVSSINAAAARAGISLALGDDSIAILPANYMDDIKTTLEAFDTVVLMKVHKVFDRVVELLREMDLTGKAVYVGRAGMEDEKIVRDIQSMKREDLSYFSMIIVRK